MAYGDRQSTKDINLADRNGTGNITGACATGSYLYFLDYVHAGDKKIRVFNATTRVEVTARQTNANAFILPHGLVSSGSRIWVLDTWTNYARAYTEPSTNTALVRDSANDINLGIGSWGGCVSAVSTLWFLDVGTDRVFAYNAVTRARDRTKDFIISAEGQTGSVESFRGATSDGTTLWFLQNTVRLGRGNNPTSVIGNAGKYLSAFTASTRVKDPNKSILINSSGDYGSCVYSGNTIWTGESQTINAYAYEANTSTAPTGTPAPTVTYDEYKLYIGR